MKKNSDLVANTYLSVKMRSDGEQNIAKQNKTSTKTQRERTRL